MAEIITQNPDSTEIQSPLIAGLTEGLNKLSQVLNLQTEEIVDAPLAAVAIDSQDENKNRIYEIPFGKKLWLKSPAVVVKKDGVVIKSTSIPFSIDHIGGSITFDTPLQDGEKITVTATCIKADSTTINTITTLLNTTANKADRYKGYFDTVETLNSQHSTGKAGDIAFVESPQFAIYAWDSKKKAWRNTQSIEDLKDYYTSSQVDEALNGKEDAIKGNEKTTDYFGGDKAWHDVQKAARETKLTGLNDKTNEAVVAADSIIDAIGKLQAQIKSGGGKSYIEGSGAPTVKTAGKVGQRYVNTSTGESFVCTAASAGNYTWKSQSDASKLNGKDASQFATGESVKIFSCKFLSSGWSASGSEYQQTVSVPNMKAEYSFECPWIMKTKDKDKTEKELEALSIIDSGIIETLEGQVKAIVPEVPKNDVTIYIRRAIL